MRMTNLDPRFVNVVRVIAFFLLFFLVASVSADDRQKISVEWKGVGVSVHTYINLDNTGAPASFSRELIRGTLGEGISHTLVEPVRRKSLEHCPKAKYEYEILESRTVVTFSRELDQLFLKAVSGESCIFSKNDKSTATAVTEFVVTGGTGRFVDASGEVTTTVNQAVIFDEWKGNYNSLESVTVGTIYLKK